jgi:organic radical activating enzyme
MQLKVSEIFFSYQGEGKYLGQPTIFVRLAGCNLKCFYCDTKYASTNLNSKVLSIKEILKKVLELKKKFSPTFVSITGGEPLQQKNLVFLIKELKKTKLKLYLETNSTLPERLKKVVSYLDIICANFKLETKLIKNFAKVIDICKKNKKEFFIKMVVTDKKYDTKIVDKTIQMFKQKKCELLVLQPESNKYKLRDKNLFYNLSFWYQQLSSLFKSVQIIPQLHKFVWKIR